MSSRFTPVLLFFAWSVCRNEQEVQPVIRQDRLILEPEAPFMAHPLLLEGDSKRLSEPRHESGDWHEG